MTLPLPVRFTANAEREIEVALGWWARNRDKAPRALPEDLMQALDLISSYPEVGTRAAYSRFAAVRRLYLSRVRYYLYYRVLRGQTSRIEVLAFWHASRSARSVEEAAGQYTPMPMGSRAA